MPIKKLKLLNNQPEKNSFWLLFSCQMHILSLLSSLLNKSNNFNGTICFFSTGNSTVKTDAKRLVNLSPVVCTLTWTMSKDPGCLSLLMMVPTRPVLRPPVTMHKLPASNLIESMILFVLMSNRITSCT